MGPVVHYVGHRFLRSWSVRAGITDNSGGEEVKQRKERILQPAYHVHLLCETLRQMKETIELHDLSS